MIKNRVSRQFINELKDTFPHKIYTYNDIYSSTINAFCFEAGIQYLIDYLDWVSQKQLLDAKDNEDITLIETEE